MKWRTWVKYLMVRLCMVSLAFVRVKGGESERFRIDCGVRQGCIMKEVKLGMGRRRFLEEGREGRLPGPLNADLLVLCGDQEVDLRAMVGWYAEVCRRKLKVNSGMI